MRRWNTRHRLLKTSLSPFRWSLTVQCVVTVAQSLLVVGVAILISYVVDAGLARKPQFPGLGAGLLATLLFGVGLRVLLSWQAESMTDRAVARLRQELLRSAEYAGGALLQGYHSGMLLSRGMEDVYTVCAGIIRMVPSTMGQLTRLAASFAAVLVLYRPVAGLLVTAVALLGAGATCLRPMLKRRQQEVRQANEQAMAYLQENLGQLELIQALGVEEESQRRFSTLVSRSLAVKRRLRTLSVGSSGVLSAATQLGTGVLVLWGIYQVSRGALSYGGLTAMLQLLSLFRGPALGLSGIWTRLAAVDVAAERLDELLQEGATVDNPCVEPPPRPLAVIFEDVSFTYPGDEAPVLAHYTARISLTGWTCLTGFSGRGKTTLFRLMMGLYPPQSGRVYVETDRGTVPCGPASRRCFAYVPQDYALFSGTIRDNLLLVAPEANQEQRLWAMTVAQASFVEELPAGEDTPVRENNAGLSKGQLQRLAIARAVLMGRPVLLLDECTSALDEETERAVLRALSGLGGAAIVVTHRPSALAGFAGLEMMSMGDRQ